MVETPIELHQFSHSHFNEKVRWALDCKRIPHVRINYLPGPHIPQIRWLSGQGQVPVLQIDGQLVHGSAAILDRIEQRFPSPPLYPADAAEREEALALQARFDKELGPEVRRAVFETTLDHPDFIVAMFAGEKPAWKQKLYRAAFPVIRTAMSKSMNITPETGRRSRERVEEILHLIASKTAATGYLVGSAFSVADLTAASLLGPAALVTHPDMRKPEPFPPRYAQLCATWAEHPAMEWCHDIWAKHRPPRLGIVIS